MTTHMLSRSVCLEMEDYSIYIGESPAEEGAYASEISWFLTDFESGQLVASGSTFW